MNSVTSPKTHRKVKPSLHYEGSDETGASDICATLEGIYLKSSSVPFFVPQQRSELSEDRLSSPFSLVEEDWAPIGL
jgi:hypothetical protein